MTLGDLLSGTMVNPVMTFPINTRINMKLLIHGMWAFL